VRRDGRWLLAVNPGSDSLSVFGLQGGNLTLTDTKPSGGGRPISVTIANDLVYVLNDASPANISGFRLSASGMLTPIIDATRSLSTADPDPAQVQFSPDGRMLVVTEKATNMISTYIIGSDLRAMGPMTQPSNGQTPFGFAFHPVLNRLLVSEAFGGMPNASALSSYQLSDDGRLRVLDGSVPTRQSAACWVATTPTGLYTYTTNAGSGTITGFRVDPAFGRLSRLQEDGVTAGEAGRSPIDVVVDRTGRFLYVLNAGIDQISGYAIGTDGRLTALPGAIVVPDGATGLAVF
jgi:6-phosphogluconolactonase (cycloisomerase 2 family)